MPSVDPRSRRSLLRSLKLHRRRRHRSRKALIRLAAGTARAKEAIRVADRTIPVRKKQLAKLPKETIGVRALKVAQGEIGVNEVGRNEGVPHERYSKANGATAPEPWCGNFMAWIFRKAGSKIMTRAMAAVRLIPGIPGMKVHSKRRAPEPGWMAIFTFDHVAIVESGNTAAIHTIEGNTSGTGTLNDGGVGEGVRRRHRSVGLVKFYVEVTR